MKNITSKLLLFATVVLVGTGCLKDKGFENHEYGINDPDSSPAGVGFPLASNARNPFGADVATNIQIRFESDPAPAGVAVTYNAANAPANDVKVNLAVDNTIITSYNTANNANILTLAAAGFTVPTSVVIPAGKRIAYVPIVLTNTATLDPTKEYGIGIKITSVEGGAQIMRNRQNLLVTINIKNKYDGVYNLRGYHNRPGLDAPYNTTVHMVTSGPRSVSMFWPSPGPNIYAHPLQAATTYYGSFTTNFTFDANDKLVSWDWSPYTTTLPVAVSPTSNSRYDPVAKIIYFHGWYNNNPGARAFFDTLRYLRAR
jgi:hypothetical protein